MSSLHSHIHITAQSAKKESALAGPKEIYEGKHRRYTLRDAAGHGVGEVGHPG